MDVLINAVTGLLQSGVALLNIVSLLFVTPVVTFYMLRDWDRMVARIEASVPPDYLPTVRRLGARSTRYSPASSAARVWCACSWRCSMRSGCGWSA